MAMMKRLATAIELAERDHDRKQAEMEKAPPLVIDNDHWYLGYLKGYANGIKFATSESIEQVTEPL